MNARLLYQTHLDLKVEFQTKEERDEYILRATEEFEENMKQRLCRTEISESDKQRLRRCCYIFIKISSYLYCPVYIRYDLSKNVVIFGLETDYLTINRSLLPEWQELMELGALDFNVSPLHNFQMEMWLYNIFCKPVSLS